MIRGTTTVVGVWGYPVRHSASPAMHNAAFAALGLDWVYVPFEVAPERIPEAVAGIRALGLRGVNVTVPLKELVPPLLDSLTPRAARLGAVNTIINNQGRLTGDSTDGRGFLAALREAGGLPDAPGARAVVLGAGGSARAVADALAEAGIAVTIANRSEARAHELAEQLARPQGPGIQVIPLTEAALRRALLAEETRLLVNTTSVGMHPREDEMPPVPEEALSPRLFVSDLIYNPPKTRLLAAAAARGCRGQNGIAMLVWQGALAFSAWTGVPDPPAEVMRRAVEAALGLAPREG